MSQSTGIREPLARAKGMGSAKSGTHHYIRQKATSVALILLGGWLLLEFMALAAAGFTQPMLIEWLRRPVDAILLAVFTVTAYIHFYGHLEEVVLDYLAGEGKRLVTLYLLKFMAVLLAVSTVYAIIFMSFMGEVGPQIPAVVQ